MSAPTQAALDAVDPSDEVKESIIEQVLDHGSRQHIEQLPQHIRVMSSWSLRITADEHIHIQAALQRFVDWPVWQDDQLPAGTTEEEVGKAFMQA